MKRVRISINDQWRYAPATEGGGAPEFDDDAWQAVDLPHTWNAHDVFDKMAPYRRGAGWYRKTLDLDPALRGKRLFLYFEGANQVADVFVNGNHAGRHIGGYTAFVFDITAVLSFDRPNSVAVRVDNSPDPDIPPLSADFNFYGGLYRNVWLLATAPLHIAVTDFASPGVFITALPRSLRVTGTVANQSDRTLAARIVHDVIDANGAVVTAVESRCSMEAGSDARFDETAAVDHPRLWSPAAPYLHRLRTRVYAGNELADEIETSFGFRSLAAGAHDGLTLNGRPLRLFGTNRHQDCAGLGSALSDDLHRRDAGIIKDNGFNFVRLAHDPQAGAMLDEADRLGLAVWEEIPIVNRISTSAAFAEHCERMLMEMIRQHYNHPSILFWGLMNEVRQERPDPLPEHYDETLLALAERLNKRAHDEDPARLTVMALSRDEIDHENGLGEITDGLGMNLYFGWYYGQTLDLGPFIDAVHRRCPLRPLIISEYGAGSDERIHSMRPRPFDFSSEYGQELHCASFPQLEQRPFLIATAVWNQFDFGSAIREDTKFGINSKGLFLYDRAPKDSAFYYQAALLAQPVLKIAREWRVRAGGRVQPVWAYTNASTVELFVNECSAGSQAVHNRTARWNVELSSGENRIVARAGSLEDAITIVLRDSTTSFAINAGTDAAYVDWEADRGFAGGAGKQTHHRIFGTDDDPLYQSVREGMRRYSFELPDGTYEVTLAFAEYGAKPGQRIFCVGLNGRQIIRDLDLAAEHGCYTAVSKSFVCQAAGGSGIAIEFEASRGEPSIAAIKINAI